MFETDEDDASCGKKFLLEYGDSLTGDSLISMPKGPALSYVYDLFKGNRSEYWDSWIKSPGSYNLALLESIKVNEKDPLDTFDELSMAEKSFGCRI